MRPLRLEVEGFTSFREKVVLEFDGLDLFAITGPTGAGKSSLIEAMVLALYGQVPRVAKEYKQLISHGAERMSVRLDFKVGDETYRIARAIRASGAPSFRLERLREGGLAEPLADRAAEIAERVERIVGLDYDAFVRSVVLPQGQFDAFLRGRPDERRKILVALLNLGVYEEMLRRANSRAAEARTEAAFLANQLAGQLAEATPETLEVRRADLARAAGEATRAEKAQGAVEKGLRAAQEVRAARSEACGITKDLDAEARRRDEAETAVAAAESQREALARRLDDVARALGSAGFDEARYVALVGARPQAEQLAGLSPRRAALARQVEEGSAALETARGALAAAEKSVASAETALDGRRTALEAARSGLEDLRARHAAHVLRGRLKAGDPCPVCEQVVGTVPKGQVPGLGPAEAALKGAERERDAAQHALQAARVAVERARGEVSGLQRDLARVEEQRREADATAETLTEVLTAAGLCTKDEARDATPLMARIVGELGRLGEARTARDRGEAERRALETESAGLGARVAAATAKKQAAAARMKELEARRESSRQALEQARAGLVRLARREGWEGLEEPLFGRDEADVIEARRSALQKEASVLAAAVARLQGEVDRLEKDLARAAEMAEKKAARERDAALATTLAHHLRADQFLAYVQEEALKVLAEDGSRHLELLSQGRYSLECEAQDFLVVDHWNADNRRSVKTLSGGETFLASLALALALAERLAELSAESRAGEALESLFLDEGFGTLDPETLDLVVQAIERLHGGERMVGVVTHIQELAERMPARIEVGRSTAGATVTVV